MSKFFLFSQNNSGGGFDFDEASGITHHVIIEATDIEDAVARAEQIGLYFNGADDDGPDCPCCGDRWYRPWGDGDNEPLIYGKPVAQATGFVWMEPGKEICVHYLDGRKAWHGMNKE
jgi:hypothetical protein